MRYVILFALAFLFSCKNEPQAPAATTGNQTQTASTAEQEQPKVGSQTPYVPPKAKEGIFLSIDDQQIKPGASFCVDVKVRDFNEVVSLQYTMNWDPKVIRFKELKGFSLKDMGPNNFGAQKAAEGFIGTSWFDMDVKGITVPDQSVIYQVCFEAIGKTGTSCNIQFSGKPVAVEISNSKGELMGFEARRAAITIQ